MDGGFSLMVGQPRNRLSELRMESIIPDDLIVSQIASRLPIKAVILCMAVCKTWRKLLSDLNFTKNYEKNPPCATVLIPRIMSRPSFCQLEFSLLEIGSESGDINSCYLTHINPKLADRLNMKSTSILNVVGSCNGLLLLSCETFYLDHVPKDVYICNPIMGEVIRLPQPNSVYSCLHYSFCYSTAVEQFKVLRVAVEARLGNNTDGEILTLGVDFEWRPLHGPFASFVRLKDGLTFKGVYHWTLSPYGTDENWIHTFDFGEEKLGEMTPPPKLSGARNFLKELNGYLSLFDLSDSSKIIVWTMKEYGLAESWAKEVILKSWCPIEDVFVWHQIYRPVVKYGAKDILFQGRFYPEHYSFMSFNAETKKFGTEVLVFKGEELAIQVDKVPLEVTYSPCFSPIVDVLYGVNKMYRV